MRSLAAGNRHRAHDSTAARPAIGSPRGSRGSIATLAACAVFIGPALWTACGPPTVPHPVHVQVRAEDYVAVPYEPRPPPVEILPARPAATGTVVWADGGWEWSGDRYRWEPGAWVVVPPGLVRARWVLVRRAMDGQLFFAPSTWRDAAGRTVEAPAALARAATRAGGAAAGGSAGAGLDE